MASMTQQHEADLQDLTILDENHEERTFATERESSSERPPTLFYNEAHVGSATAADSNPDFMPPALPMSTVSESVSSEFQFVNISDPSNMKSSKNRKLVRRSVAVSYRRKQLFQHATLPRSEEDHHSCLDTHLNSRSTVNYCQVCGYSLEKEQRSRSRPDEREDIPCDAGSVVTNILGAGK
jgi:hypothetical protein